MLFAHTGHGYDAGMCCSAAVPGIAVMALVLSLVAVVIALKKQKTK